MGEASRRVRESNAGVASAAADVHEPSSTGGDRANSRPPIPEAERPTENGSGSELVHHDLAFSALTGQDAAALRQRRLRQLARVGVLCGAVLAITVIALNAGGGSGSSRTNAVARTGPHPSTTSLTHPTAPPPAPTSPPLTTAVQPAPAAPVPTTPTTPPAATPGGAPELSSITPAQGTAGQTVVVSGTNLKSSDGQVLARFNGQPAGTSCSAPTSCTLTVPAMSGVSSSITVTVTTAAGTSNSLAFSYG